MRIVVDFPEPFGPRKPVTTPGAHVEAQLVDGELLAVVLGEALASIIGVALGTAVTFLRRQPTGVRQFPACGSTYSSVPSLQREPIEAA